MIEHIKYLIFLIKKKIKYLRNKKKTKSYDPFIY